MDTSEVFAEGAGAPDGLVVVTFTEGRNGVAEACSDFSESCAVFEV